MTDDEQKVRDYIDQLKELSDNPPEVTSPDLDRALGVVQHVMHAAIERLELGLKHEKQRAATTTAKPVDS